MWRCKEWHKMTAYRAMEVCIFYSYLILSTNGALFHAVEVQTKEDEVVTCGTKLCIFCCKMYYFIFRYCWGTSEDEEVTACGAMKVCIFYCYYSIRASPLVFFFVKLQHSTRVFFFLAMLMLSNEYNYRIHWFHSLENTSPQRTSSECNYFIHWYHAIREYISPH